jgi:Flp pilus assembly protein TadB
MMMKYKRRTIVFVGATAIEWGLALLLGLDFTASLFVVVIGNLLTAQFVDWVYKNKRFK